MGSASQRPYIGKQQEAAITDPAHVATGAVPLPLRRPFRAIFFEWGGIANANYYEDATPLVRATEPLLDMGVWLIVVTSARFSDIDRQFCHLMHEQKLSHLLICTNSGAEVFGFTAQGSPLRLWSCAPTTDEGGIRDEAIAWFKCELLAPEGIMPSDVLIVGDELGKLTGTAGNSAGTAGNSDRTQAYTGEATIVSEGDALEGTLPNVVQLGGDPSRFRQVLEHQIALHHQTEQHRSPPIRADNTAPDAPRATDAEAAFWTEAAFHITDDPNWLLQTQTYVPALEHDIETRFAIGNGFLGIRGALDMPTRASHPRAFVAGLFASKESASFNLPALAPLPDWLNIDVFVDGTKLTLDSPKVEWHRRVLDMRRGVVITEWSSRLANIQKTIRLRTLRLASSAARNVTLHITHVSPSPEASPVEIILHGAPTLRASVLTYNSRAEETASEHTQRCEQIPGSVSNHSDTLLVQVPGSKHMVALAGGIASWIDGKPVEREERDSLTPIWKWEGQSARGVTFARAVASALGSTVNAASNHATTALWRAWREPPAALLHSHLQAWAERWTASDILIDGDDEAQVALRFAMYHLISAADPTRNEVSIGARGLTGEGYLGHVFWDTDIFTLPFFIFTWPDAARALLHYRYHTLPAARAKAASMGYRGALYAWESADTGDEVTPPFIERPDGVVLPVLCGKQEHHISADVAYAIWRYWQATGDDQFLLDAGAEILLETARFWASRTDVDASGQRHIYGVIGPDEYHEDIGDNAYTNEMARWNIERGVETAVLLTTHWPARWAELSERLGLSDAELVSWATYIRLLAPPHTTPDGVIEQFAGYFNREDITLTTQKPGDLPIDLLLGSDRVTSSQILKQADVLMLLALLEEQFSTHDLEANFRYYAPRCAQGSSLSPGVHACIAARIGDLAAAERYLRQAMRIDLSDTLGISAQGVHMGALGGMWTAIVFGFLGLKFNQENLRIDPHLLPSWQRLRIPVQWRNRRLTFDVAQQPLKVRVRLEDGAPCTVMLGNMQLHLNSQQTVQARSDDDGRTWREEIQ